MVNSVVPVLSPKAPETRATVTARSDDGVVPGTTRGMDMAHKITLTDRLIRSPKLRPAKGRVFVWDSQVPGLGLRITDKDNRVFYLVKRYPGSPHPAPRLLAKLGELDLAKVRAKAREWIALLEKGVDPRLDVIRQRMAEQQRRDATIAAVWQAYYDA